MCRSCGTYRGREIVDVLARTQKRLAKMNEEQKAEAKRKEAGEKPLDATALSKKK